MKIKVESCKKCPLFGSKYEKRNQDIVLVWCNHPMSKTELPESTYKDPEEPTYEIRGFKVGMRKPPKKCPLRLNPLEIEVSN